MAEPTLTKAEALEHLRLHAAMARVYGSERTADTFDALAAWLAAACVVEGGHFWLYHDEPVVCRDCGQRRDVANA